MTAKQEAEQQIERTHRQSRRYSMYSGILLACAIIWTAFGAVFGAQGKAVLNIVFLFIGAGLMLYLSESTAKFALNLRKSLDKHIAGG